MSTFNAKEAEMLQLEIDTISHDELKKLVYFFWEKLRDQGFEMLESEHEETNMLGRSISGKANFLRNLILHKAQN